MTEAAETRLDRLWAAVADTGAEADWLRFYEGFAAQRLIVPVDDPDADALAPLTLPLADGPVALAFDTEARFAAFITRPTAHATLTGAWLAAALAPHGTGVALNPGVAPGETVLGPEAIGWIARHAAAEVAVEERAARLAAPPRPEPELIEALGLRLAEYGAAVEAAWLAGDGAGGYVCVLCPAAAAAALADGMAAELARIGQLRTPRPFAVALARPGGRLPAAARRLGIGLAPAAGG